MFSKRHFEMFLLRENKSKEDVASHIDINIATLYRKMNGDSDFYGNEIQKISIYLNLSNEEKDLVFFNSEIA